MRSHYHGFESHLQNQASRRLFQAISNAAQSLSVSRSSAEPASFTLLQCCTVQYIPQSARQQPSVTLLSRFVAESSNGPSRHAALPPPFIMCLRGCAFDSEQPCEKPYALSYKAAMAQHTRAPLLDCPFSFDSLQHGGNQCGPRQRSSLPNPMAS